MENIVAQMLTATGKKLYFYFNYDKKDSSNNMEIDFLIAKSKITSRHNISPIEVKSGKNYTFSSLNKFRKKYKEYLATGYVLHIEDLKVENDIVFLLLMLSYSFMQHGVIESMLKEQNKHFLNKIKERRANQKFQLILIIIFVIFVGLIFYLSLYNPTISIVFFVILPVISSLSYLWGDSRFDQDARNKRINR